MPTFAKQVTAVAALDQAIDGTPKPRRRRRIRERSGRGISADRRTPADQTPPEPPPAGDA